MTNYVTGVVGNNGPEGLFDDVDFGQDSIDLTCDGCEYSEQSDSCDGCETTHEHIIGFRLDKDGLYEPNPEAEYSAIVGESVTQVVRSDWLQLCWPCSPCYPGQGDLDSPANEGDYRELNYGDAMTMALFASAAIGGDTEYTNALRPQVASMQSTGEVVPMLAYTLPPEVWGDSAPDGIRKIEYQLSNNPERYKD